MQEKDIIDKIIKEIEELSEKGKVEIYSIIAKKIPAYTLTQTAIKKTEDIMGVDKIPLKEVIEAGFGEIKFYYNGYNNSTGKSPYLLGITIEDFKKYGEEILDFEVHPEEIYVNCDDMKSIKVSANLDPFPYSDFLLDKLYQARINGKIKKGFLEKDEDDIYYLIPKDKEFLWPLEIEEIWTIKLA